MKKLIISIILLLNAQSCFASQKLLINEEEMINVVFSKTRINRISAKDDLIRKVIGNSNEFHYETDNGNVYILPYGDVGSHFELSINLDSGKTQSLRARVSSVDEGQIILLSSHKSNVVEIIQDKALSVIKEMAVIHDHKFTPYNVIKFDRSVKILESHKIDFDQVEGFKILVKNLTRRERILNEKDLIIPGYKTMAVSLVDQVLAPYQETLILAVAEKR